MTDLSIYIFINTLHIHMDWCLKCEYWALGCICYSTALHEIESLTCEKMKHERNATMVYTQHTHTRTHSIYISHGHVSSRCKRKSDRKGISKNREKQQEQGRAGQGSSAVHGTTTVRTTALLYIMFGMSLNSAVVQTENFLLNRE